MTRAYRALSVVGAAVLAACSSAPPKDTLATLNNVQPDLQDVKVEGGLDTAMQSYQRFLEETPETQRTPEAMRRLADLKIEKEYGLNGTGELLELPAPQARRIVRLKPDRQPPAASVLALWVGLQPDNPSTLVPLRSAPSRSSKRALPKSSASPPCRTCCKASCPKA